MRRLPDPTLVVLVGPSAAGKSHWAAEHFAADQVVSGDRLRAVVGEGEHDLSASREAFAVLDAIVAARMRRRLTTVVDTLGLDPDLRRRWRDVAARHDVPCVAVAFDTAAAECRRRNAARDHRVPAPVLAGQLRSFAEVRPTLDDEGFAQVVAPEPVRLVLPDVVRGSAPRPGTGPTGACGAAAGGAPEEVTFGLHLSTFDIPGGPPRWRDRIPEVASAAERAGFTSIWVMDHLRQIPQLGRPWDDLPESTAVLGYLAAATRTASVGCLVSCVTYRNLAHLAKIVATLDVLSGGRAWCGLGAGWFRAEHEAYGWRFPPDGERLDLLEDALHLLPLMWGPGTPGFEGRRTAVPEAMCYPRPLGRVPILVGGSGERRTLRLVARHADACNLTGDAATVRRKVEVLHGHCADVGRDPEQVLVTHLSTALVAADGAELDRRLAARRPNRSQARWTAWTNPGTVDDHVLRVRALREAGVRHVIVHLDDVWDSPAVERYAEVIAASRS